MAQIRSKQIADFLASVNWSNVSANDIANAADIDARFTTAEDFSSDLADSVDSLETALSTEIEATNTDVTALENAIAAEETRATGKEGEIDNSIDSLEGAIDALEYKHDSEMEAHHDEHLSLIAAEESRAIDAEGDLADSVDSLETALSTEIEATNSEVIRVDGRITSEMKVERDRIDNMLSSADVDLDQFVEVVSYIDGLDLENDNIFISREGFVDDRLGELNDSVDSLEVSLSTEIEATNAEVNDINDSIDSLEEKATTDVADINDSIDSLETALSTEIEATNSDVTRIDGTVLANKTELDASVDSLEGAIDALEGKHDSEMEAHHDEHLSLIAAEESRAIVAEGDLADSVDSLETALSTEIEATNADVTALYQAISDEEGRASGAEGDLAASVDSLEVAMDALEGNFDSEMQAHHEEHLSLIAAEESRAIVAEDKLADSVDSLETALSTEIEATNSEVVRIDGRITSEMLVERLRIDNMLSSADIDLDQFVEVVSYIDGLDLENDNIFIARESYVDVELGKLVNSVDSLETALSTEIEATNADVTGINNSIDSLEIALENGSGALVDSVDSLETALSAEIEATNADFLAVNASVDSLEVALAAETAARDLGDTYVDAKVNGVDAAAGSVAVNVPTHEFQMGAFDTEVYVNGLRVEFTQEGPQDFTLSVNYPIEATDIIRFVGVGNDAIA